MPVSCWLCRCGDGIECSEFGIEEREAAVVRDAFVTFRYLRSVAFVCEKAGSLSARNSVRLSFACGFSQCRLQPARACLLPTVCRKQKFIEVHKCRRLVGYSLDRQCDMAEQGRWYAESGPAGHGTWEFGFRPRQTKRRRSVFDPSKNSDRLRISKMIE